MNQFSVSKVLLGEAASFRVVRALRADIVNQETRTNEMFDLDSQAVRVNVCMSYIVAVTAPDAAEAASAAMMAHQLFRLG